MCILNSARTPLYLYGLEKGFNTENDFLRKNTSEPVDYT
jgi:hypothetical protein